MTMPLETHLILTLDSDRLGEFFALFQQGVAVHIRLGCTLEELLCSQWEMDPEYVKSRITTIFLNNRAIDDIAATHVGEGAVLALSGAMPGLVGATMRRGGFYAAMRGAMTYRENEDARTQGCSTLRLKLFNLLLPELSLHFLKRGIVLERGRAMAFFREREPEFWSGCHLALLNGTQVTPHIFSTTEWLTTEHLMLMVNDRNAP